MRAGDGIEQCGLAGAIGADDGAALAPRHNQADAIDRPQGIEGHHHICQRQDRFGHE